MRTIKSPHFVWALGITAIVQFSVLDGQAEVFLGPTTPTNRLIIREGHAILVNTLADFGDHAEFTFVVGTNRYERSRAGTTSSGYSSYFSLNSPQFAFAGPAELVFPATRVDCSSGLEGGTSCQTNRTSVVVSYQQLETTMIHTVAYETNDTVVIDVPAGKKIQFFRTVGGLDVGAIFVLTKDNNSLLCYVLGGELFQGPVRFSNDRILVTKTAHDVYPGWRDPDWIWSISAVGIISYLLTDDTAATVLPESVALSVPPGSQQITLEKSSNLTNWFPVVIQPIGPAVQEYYRFRIDR